MQSPIYFFKTVDQRRKCNKSVVSTVLLHIIHTKAASLWEYKTSSSPRYKIIYERRSP